jgi:hypothetical protein
MTTGAKYAYVTVGPKDCPIVVMLNIDCGAPVCEDFARQQLLGKIEAKLKDPSLLVLAPTVVEGEEGAGEGGDVPKVDVKAYLLGVKAALEDATSSQLSDSTFTKGFDKEERLVEKGRYSFIQTIVTHPEEGSEEPPTTSFKLLMEAEPVVEAAPAGKKK